LFINPTTKTTLKKAKSVLLRRENKLKLFNKAPKNEIATTTNSNYQDPNNSQIKLFFK
jgi:predicted DNA-binding protein YlxM (UPF0122 family)